MGTFEVLPLELVVSILAALASCSEKPMDLFNAMLVCKKFSELVMTAQVLKAASAACLGVRSNRWCAAAERFLRRCGDYGNADANYLLGMIQFYCLRDRRQGWSRLTMAVSAGHAEATFAVAIIRLNGAGTDAAESRDLRAAAHLFAHAAARGHHGALRDLGFCVSNGLGVPQNPALGRNLTIWANTREVMEMHSRPQSPERDRALALAHFRGGGARRRGCLLSDLGCFAAVPPMHGWAHPANRFMAEWFAASPRPLPASPQPLRLMCSFPTCGRPETRTLEFRRCTMCAIARYCSRTCQSLHWRMGHREECIPVHQWLVAAFANQNPLPPVGQLYAPAGPAPVNDDAANNNIGGAAPM